MQQIVGHKPKLCLIVIYKGYWRIVNSLQCDVESTSELDYEGANTTMGFDGSNFELKYNIDIVYEGWIGSWFTLIYKDVVRTLSLVCMLTILFLLMFGYKSLFRL